jgi:putative hydrolase of the HAD superfamily
VASIPAGAPLACLVDVYDTILSSGWRERAGALARLAGVPAGQWQEQWFALAGERDRGALTMAGAFAKALAACGRDPDPSLVASLVTADAELLAASVVVCDDTAEFFATLRARGIGVALVSNCSANTRPMLAARGLLGLADTVILSCEAGVAKPEPEIYLMALQSLGVIATEAVMLDDQPSYCAGAAAVGVRPIQVVRPGIATRPADPRFTSVPSLLDVLPLLHPGA